MATPTHDPYGELDYGGWEDPFAHKLLRNCPGCVLCVAWDGKTGDQISAARARLVTGRRHLAVTEPTARQVAQEDRDYWNSRYDD